MPPLAGGDVVDPPLARGVEAADSTRRYSLLPEVDQAGPSLGRVCFVIGSSAHARAAQVKIIMVPALSLPMPSSLTG